MTNTTKDRESEMLLMRSPLYTEVTGYIGFQTLTAAIERKYRVRAVVRKEQDVLELQRKIPAITSALAQDQLELALVPNF
ncbi:NAD-dependent epimerase/dehydratase [Penicillium frequentans]|uniref:NAD-dependent epimerase/dehydratase n=1 Tax=Penicillium frequentans TaxID=3151616 RepID=A0AAD6CMN5_9EURO|nr:NAD-dependent epimerase/dehydratase [Penicillium glabrum]